MCDNKFKILFFFAGVSPFFIAFAKQANNLFSFAVHNNMFFYIMQNSLVICTSFGFNIYERTNKTTGFA
jgi:hypothetical protein